MHDELYKAIESIRGGSADEAIRLIEDYIAEDLVDILAEHSYDWNHQYEGLWWHHSCMSDQEHALSKLLELGLFEMHPSRPTLYRPVDKNHYWYAFHKGN